MSVQRQRTMGSRHEYRPAAPVGAAAGTAPPEYQPGTGNATPERMYSVSRRKAPSGSAAQGEMQRTQSVRRDMPVHRSNTQRKGGGGTDQKKGYDIVKQGIFQIHPAVDGPQAASSKPGDSAAQPGKSGEALKTDKQTNMDIVFVPGLGADPEQSWVSVKTNFSWLKDKQGIARDFPKARILLYKFSSAWIGPLKVQQDLSNLASTLIDGLKFKRQGSGSRPIVFIGHSMGGLIIAKAIELAATNKTDHPNFFEDIAGCAFFGTPFEGAEAAAHGHMIAHIGRMIGKAEVSRLLALMRPGDPMLEQLRKNFMKAVSDLSPYIKLYSFYEEHPTEMRDMSGLPGIVRRFNLPLSDSLANFVTEKSAVLDTMDSKGLAANHRDLVKFDGPKDERYNLVRGCLKTLINSSHQTVKARRNATRNVDQGLVTKVLDTLDGAQPRRKRMAIGKTVAPSSWVSDENHYTSWLAKFDDSPVSSVPKQGDCLWIRGPDGRGKTSATLAALEGIELLQKQENNNPTVLLAYFFCDHTSDYDTAEELLKSLVQQLIKQRNVLASHAKFLLRKKGNDTKAHTLLTVQNMWQVLQDMLADEDLIDNRIYFVLNNLESLPSDADSTDTFMELLKAELEQMNSGRKSIVRWMITSSYSVGQQVRSNSIRVIDLEDEKYGDQVKRELRQHAYKKVSSFVRQRNYSKALAYYASSLIGRRAQNTQWIDMTIVQLEQFSPEEDDLRIRLHLEIMPEQLDELLRLAWMRVFSYKGNDEDGIKDILRVLVLTSEDPTEEELGLLTDMHSTEGKQRRLRELVDQCKPLVKVTSKATGGSERMTRIGFEQPFVKQHLYDNAYKLLGLTDEDIRLNHGMLAFRSFSHIVERFSIPIFWDDDTPYFNNQPYGPDQMNRGVPVYDQHGNYLGVSADNGGHYGQGDMREPPYEPNNTAYGQYPQTNGDNMNYTMAAAGDGEGEDEDESELEEGNEHGDGESDDDESRLESNPRPKKTQEDQEAEILEHEIKALPYAVKHWMSHASKATDEIAEDLVAEKEFWEKDSDVRRRWLIEHTRLVGPNDSFKYTKLSTLTGLHVAGGIGFRHLIITLMKGDNKDEINKRDAGDNTPLHFAAHFGRADLVEELLNHGAIIDDGIDECVETPLAMAAEEGKVKVMTKLLNAGADPNAISEEYGGVINAAISSGNCDAVRLLVAQNVSLASQEEAVKKKMEALEAEKAARKEAEETARKEAEEAARKEAEANGYETHSYDGENEEQQQEESESESSGSEQEDQDEYVEVELIRSPLALAALRSDLTMFNFLIEEYADKLPPEEFNTALIKAAEHGRMETFLRLYRNYRHPKSVIENALNASCKERQWDIIRFLLEEYPGLDCNQAFLNTCRGYDAEQEIKVLREMWEYSNKSIRQDTLDNSLYHATDYEAIETVKMLLDLGANANATGDEYGNALTASAYDGTLQILEILLDHGADVNSPDGWALQTAAELNHVEIVETLLRSGADVNALTTHPNMPHGTALQAAVESGNEGIVIQLLEYRADPDKGPLPDLERGYQTCPLIAAIEGSWTSILERLIHARANLQVVGGRYTSGPIECAVSKLPLQYVKMLLDEGADINTADDVGDTALIVEAWEGDAENVQFLLDRGADVLHRNNEGLNALQLALRNPNNFQVVNILIAHVSLLMGELSQAVQEGDRSVTAIVRSVQNRRQGLEYDDPSTAEADQKSDEAGADADTNGNTIEASDRDQLPSAAQGRPGLGLNTHRSTPSQTHPTGQGVTSPDGTNTPIVWQTDEPPSATRAQTFPMLASENEPKPQQQQQQYQAYIPWRPDNTNVTPAPLRTLSQESQLNSAMTGETLVSNTTPDRYYSSYTPPGNSPRYDHRASIHSIPPPQTVTSPYMASQTIGSPHRASPPVISPPMASPQFQQRPPSTSSQGNITPYHYVSPYKKAPHQPMQPRYLSYQLQHPQRAVGGAEQYQNPAQSPPPGTPYQQLSSRGSIHNQSPPAHGGNTMGDFSSVSSYFPWSGES